MSLPNIPNINPEINLKIEDSIKLLLNSIAMEEIGLSHILNAEGEKLQCIIKKMEKNLNSCEDYDFCNERCKCDRLESSEILLKFNNSVNETIKNVFRSQSLLQLKLEDVKELYKIIEEREVKKSNNIIPEMIEKECMIEKRYEHLNKNKEIDEEEVVCKPIYINRG